MNPTRWREASTVFRVGLVGLLVQVGVTLAGFVLIDAARVAVQWDFPTGRPTNELPKWLGLLVFPVITGFALRVFTRAVDAPGSARVLRLGILLIFTAAQLAILFLNV